MIVRRYQIHLKNLPQAFWGYKLLFLTDLHGCVTPLLPERIAAERPDAILIGGDMMVWKKKSSEKQDCRKQKRSLPGWQENTGYFMPMEIMKEKHCRKRLPLIEAD